MVTVAKYAVGAGWVIVTGMDCCESNDQPNKLLINAVTYR